MSSVSIIDTPKCSLLLSAIQGYLVGENTVTWLKPLANYDGIESSLFTIETVPEAVAIVSGMEIPTGLRVTAFRQLWLDTLAYQEKLDRPYIKDVTP